MTIPLQISFRNLEASAAIEDSIHEHAGKLELFNKTITRCRVMVESHHRHHRKGKLFYVRIDLTAPGAEIVVSREPQDEHSHEDVYVAIRDAFDAARRQLQDGTHRIQGSVKTHVDRSVS